MKFDLIISNPPYKNNLHLKILNEVKDLSDKICFVHPSTWLYDNKDMFNLFIETKENFKDRFARFEVVENANELFGIGAFVPIIISVFDKNSKDLIDIHNIDIHGDSNVYKSMKDKILDYCKESNVHDNIQKNKNKYEVGIAAIRGHFDDPDFYTMIQKANEYLHIGNETKYDIKFYFNTKQEAINFKDYLKTKMARFCLSIYKLNQNLISELASVPYLPTYENNWTDEMVAKEIGLSDEELRWAIKYIPDYYPEDKHSGSNVYKNIETKILDYCKESNVHDNIQKNKNKYEVGISLISPGGRDVMIQKTNEAMHIGSETKYPLKFYFNTKQEAINFKDYLKTKMARFCLSIYKINQHLDSGELASVPYLPTYKYKWTDEMVAKEIGLSDEELECAINYIPDYYPEDKEI